MAAGGELERGGQAEHAAAGDERPHGVITSG